MERPEHLLLFGLYLAAAPQALPGWRTLQMPAWAGLVLALALALLFGQRIRGERSATQMRRARQQTNTARTLALGEKANSQLVSLDYTSCPIWWYAGQALATEGRLKEAIPYFEQAHAAHPNHLQTLSDLGSCYQRTGRQADAVSAYKSAIRISPNFTDANLNLVVAYYKANQMDSALTALCKMPFLGYGHERFKTVGRTIVYFELDRIGKKYPTDSAVQTRVTFLKNYRTESLNILRSFWHTPSKFEDSIRNYPYYRMAQTHLAEQKGLFKNDAMRGEPEPVRPL